MFNDGSKNEKPKDVKREKRDAGTEWRGEDQRKKQGYDSTHPCIVILFQ